MARIVNILPLSRDPSSRFLPWIIAFMVWLAALSLAASMMLASASKEWQSGLAGSITVQIIPGESDDPGTMEDKTERVVALLSTVPGIRSAEALPRAKVNKLLEPWLGKDALSGALALPIPVLVDVRLEDGTALDTDALAARLGATIPGASLDDHGLWLERLVELAEAVRLLALIVMVLIGSAAVATVIFATRTGLAIHAEIIELMHLIGARESYIARQFSMHAFMLGLKGGLAGLLLASATLLVLGNLAARVGTGLLPPFALTPVQWGAVAAVGMAAALLSTLTASMTVRRVLRRMP